MSSEAPRRWLNWRSNGQITAKPTTCEPTKPSKLGSEGFVGSPSASFVNIRADDASDTHARAVVEVALFPVDCEAHPETPMSWTAWKAKALNTLFLVQGCSGERGRITEDTVRHGERVGMAANTGLVVRGKTPGRTNA